jgi:transcriptional regulator with XRE-family HTH domain
VQTSSPTIRAGIRLGHFRRQAGISQDDLCSRIGILDPARLDAIEVGDEGLDVPGIIAASDALGVPSDSFTNPFLLVGEAAFVWHDGGGRTVAVPGEVEERIGERVGAYLLLSASEGEEARCLPDAFHGPDLASGAGALGVHWAGAMPGEGTTEERLSELLRARLGVPVVPIDPVAGTFGGLCLARGRAVVLVDRTMPPDARVRSILSGLHRILARTGPGIRLIATESFADALVGPPEGWDLSGPAELPAFGRDYLGVMADAIAHGRISVRRLAKLLGVDLDGLDALFVVHGIPKPYDL